MATMHCPTCAAPMKVLSTRNDPEKQAVIVEIQASCSCNSEANARITTIRPTAIPDSTPEPQHRTTQF